MFKVMITTIYHAPGSEPILSITIEDLGNKYDADHVVERINDGKKNVPNLIQNAIPLYWTRS